VSSAQIRDGHPFKTDAVAIVQVHLCAGMSPYSAM